MKAILTAILLINITILSSSFAQDAASRSDEICPILVGQELPEGELLNEKNEEVKVHEIVKTGPTVMIYYRGGWCPYCNKQLAALNEIEQEILDLGFKIVAVSADDVDHLKTTQDDEAINYTLFSDASMTYARKLGIAFKVDDKTRKKYKTFGIDLEEASGESHFELPAPAVFVTDKKGLIHFSYINPNYKVRLDAQVLLAVLKQMKNL